MGTYRIVRFFQDDDMDNETIMTGLTLTQAKEHCNNPETSSSTATSQSAKAISAVNGAWFDGYEEES